MTMDKYPWRIWHDGLTEEAAQCILLWQQKSQPEYEFRIIPTTFHDKGFFAIEGKKIILDHNKVVPLKP